MERAEDAAGERCRRCGWPESQPFETVSRHRVSNSLIVYTRCACGRLQVRFHPRGGAESIGRRRPAGRMLARGARGELGADPAQAPAPAPCGRQRRAAGG